MGTAVHFRNPHFLYFPSHHSCTTSSIILYTEAVRVPTAGLGPARLPSPAVYFKGFISGAVGQPASSELGLCIYLDN